MTVLKHIYPVYILVCLACFVGCAQESKDDIQRLFCDAETVIDGKFISNLDSFANGKAQSDEAAYSGSHSAKLQKGLVEYGMTYRFDVSEGERFLIKVKRYSESGKGTLEAAAKKIHLGFFATRIPTTTQLENNWEELRLDFIVPYGVKELAVFVKNTSEEPVYFDDLEIIRYKPKSPVYKDKAALELFIDSLDLAEMAQLRESALKQGDIIDPETKKEFDCVLVHDDKHYSGTIRFKGDWTDHLKLSKWSFRVELDGGRTIFGKRTFSIQHPVTRGYAKEWLLHELLKKEEVLTTRYEFLPVELNGKNLGLYAFEEHFEKQILESQNRREGVILKMDEELFWKGMLVKKREGINQYFPSYRATYFKPFKKKKTLKSKTLRQQLALGNNLLEMHRAMHPDVGKYMDIDRLTKYLAVLTITNTPLHSIEWHNQRWYFNPVTARLEPIAFDFSDDFTPRHPENEVFKRFMDMNKENPVELRDYSLAFLLKNPDVQEQYIAHLERMLEPKYLPDFLEGLTQEINEVDKLLSVEFPEERVQQEMLLEQASQAKEQLPAFKKWLKEGLAELKPDSSNKRIGMHIQVSERLPVRVYRDGHQAYTVESYAGHTISVFGYEQKETGDTILLKSPINIGVNRWNGDRKTIDLNDVAASFYYTIEGSDFVGSASIVKWPAPIAQSPRKELISGVANNSSAVVEKDGAHEIKAGKHIIDKLIYIPKATKLTIAAGTELIFKNTGGILSESPVYFMGNADSPIIIRSDSKNNNGVTVLQASTRSELNHVQFNGLNRLYLNGWELTGGVNFYESDLVMRNCSVNNGISEDALNIIRSDFELTRCSIDNSKSDGFDSDFSTGLVKDCKFTNIGNDAVDFSGSQVEIRKCTMKNIGDKAISVGEASTVKIENTEVDGSQIGVAAKDLSKATISNSTISNCKFGYVAYTKKSEYGGATIKTKNVKLKAVEKEADIELNSLLIDNGKKKPGSEYSRITKY